MNKKILTLTLMTGMLILSFIPQNLKAASDDYNIEQVHHTVELMSNGDLFVNDTITLTGEASQGFLIGFPQEYTSHVLQCNAFNATDDFPVSLDVPLDGFYGVKVNFPQGTPSVFTVGFVLSDDLLVRETSNISRLEFPVYPCLTKKAGIFNGSIVLPEDSEYLNGTVTDLVYSQEDLPAFTNLPGNVTFTTPEERIPKVDITQLHRKININGMKGIMITDTYHITNKDTQEISSFDVILPEGASPQKAYDFLERPLEEVQQVSESPNKYWVIFTLKTGESCAVDSGDSYVFSVKYSLPGESYIIQEGSTRFQASFPLYYNLDYYVLQSSTEIMLPEGGKILDFQNSTSDGRYSVTRSVFQETLTIQHQGLSSLNGFTLSLGYTYNLLWLAFRPTLWMFTLTIVGIVLAVVWKRRPKPPAPTAVSEVEGEISSEDIQSFVEAYERKRKITPKLESLETRAKKGKISRRRYKVRRKTLETKLETISRKLEELKDKFKAAGGRYANLMDRLEIAETEIKEVEANINSIDARHRRGDLSLGAYRKLLSEYEDRREKAETAINRVLIRMREEIQ